jgi:hypothetical protein
MPYALSSITHFRRQRAISATAFAIVALLSLSGCKSTAPAKPPQPTVQTEAVTYPARPTTPPPPFNIFHQDNDTYTLVTRPNASDDEIVAILYQLRDAARAHSFDAIHLSQAFVDARKPIVWFHVYRGPKCASEKYTKGPYPCGASYHGAGDYTLGDYKNPQWDDAVLLHPDGTETHLWDPDAPRTHPPQAQR